MYWQIFSDNRSYPTLLQNCSTGCALAMPAHDSSPTDFSMQSRPSYKEVRKYTLPQAKAEAGSAVCFSFLFVYMLSSSSAYLLLSSLQHTKLEYRNQDNLHLSRLGQKKFIFFCTYSIKPLLIFKVQNSLLLLTFSLLPLEEAGSFFTTGFLYYLFCLLHCFGDKTLL